jgi:hypothetical protein
MIEPEPNLRAVLEGVNWQELTKRLLLWHHMYGHAGPRFPLPNWQYKGPVLTQSPTEPVRVHQPMYSIFLD